MPPTEQGDTSVLTALFGHNTWANRTLLEFCAGLSAEQLDATAVGGFGSIRATLVHIAYSEVDYVNLATEKWPAVVPPSDRFVGFAVLQDAVRWAGAELLQLALAARADTIVRVMRPQEPIFEYPLAGLLVQVLNHSTEHRTQISAILTQLGIAPPALSGWTYLREQGEFHEFAAPTEGS
jgi:uncharacterized damage-inducible protein DinB